MVRVTTEPDDRVFVALERDESGYPPWDEEEIWAIPQGDGLFELDASPTFADGLSHRDLVHAVAFEGKWWVDRVEEHRGHSTIRIIAFDDSTHDEIIDLGRRYGCDVDHTELAGLYAVDIPPAGDYAGLRRALAEGQAHGWWDFDEGNINARHQQ